MGAKLIENDAVTVRGLEPGKLAVIISYPNYTAFNGLVVQRVEDMLFVVGENREIFNYKKEEKPSDSVFILKYIPKGAHIEVN
jgi:hypothetical protein